jgi:hypothetical protein
MRAAALEFDANFASHRRRWYIEERDRQPFAGTRCGRRCLDRDHGEDRPQCSEEHHSESAKGKLHDHTHISSVSHPMPVRGKLAARRRHFCIARAA